MKFLIVVDMQNDFVTDALGTKEAEAILTRVIEKVKSFDGEIWLTKDTHTEDYLNTQEGKYLPVQHCVKGTSGWDLPQELETVCEQRGAKTFEKPTFGSIKLAEELKKLYDNGEVDSVELIGLCTDICVISNALLLKAYMPELHICTDPSCCAGVTPEKHNAALEVMRSCQIQLLG